MKEALMRTTAARAALEITLVRPHGSKEWRLDRMVFGQDVFRMTMNPFGEKPKIGKVFSKHFVAAISPYLPDLDGGDIVLASSVAIELPDVVLSKMRVLFTASAGQSQLCDPRHLDAADADKAAAQTTPTTWDRMMIRFQQAIGDLQSILLPPLRSGSTLHTLELEAARALADLLHPCLDLASVEISELTGDQYRQVMERLHTLKSTKVEIGIFAHLLRRFLDRAQPPCGDRLPDRDERIERGAIHPRYQPMVEIG